MLVQVPRTLDEAHDLLTRIRPCQGAEPAVWLSFHRQAAEMYANTAKVDPMCRREAQRWAAWELRTVRDIEDRMNPAMVGGF